MIQMHKNQIEWFKAKLGVSDYAIAWIAFIKGLIFGLLLNYFLWTVVKNEKNYTHFSANILNQLFAGPNSTNSSFDL